MIAILLVCSWAALIVSWVLFSCETPPRRYGLAVMLATLTTFTATIATIAIGAFP